MHIVIVGPGALGSLFSTRLTKCFQETENRVTLLDHSPDRADVLNTSGITLEQDGKQENCRVAVSSSPEELRPADVLLFCVKSYDLNASLQYCAPITDQGTMSVFLQNGIGHLDLNNQSDLKTTPVFGCTSEGANLPNPGHVRYAGAGHTHLGFLSQAKPEEINLLKKTVDALVDCGFACSISKDILSRLWGKLFINISINPLTAIFKRTNGQLLTSCAARSQMQQIIQEAEAIARAKGITILEDPCKAAATVCRRTSANISSMLRDVQKKRLTEIEAMNGAVVREGLRAGIPTPINEQIVKKIHAIEETYST